MMVVYNRLQRNAPGAMADGCICPAAAPSLVVG